jgi:hypothetical protein
LTRNGAPIIVKDGANMEKISNERIICSIMGCSRVAEELSDPPLCSEHSHEKTASCDTDYGLSSVTEMTDQIWGTTPDVHNK